MASSMTGWGSARGNGVAVNIRGVNSKYREIVLHSGQEFFEAEQHINLMISQMVSRGRIDVYISADKNSGCGKIRIDEKKLKAAAAEFRRACSAAGLKAEARSEFIIEKSGCIAEEGGQPGAQGFSWKKIRPVFAGAMEDFIKMKKSEGKKLAADILAGSEKITGACSAIREAYIEARGAYAQKAKERIEALFKGEEKPQLSSSVVEILDKFEINEELVRLSSHIEQLAKIVSAKENAGRKIDFMAQEINREANTISSKIQDPRVCSAVIEIKEAAEKIREQAMNLE